MIHVYIAGSSRELGRARRWMDAVNALPNVRVEFDWVTAIQQERVDHPDVQLDSDLPQLTRQRIASTERAAVLRSNVLWLLYPDTPGNGTGCFIEYGIALGRDPSPVVLASGPRVKATPFTSMAREFDEDQDAFRHLVRMSASPEYPES